MLVTAWRAVIPLSAPQHWQRHVALSPHFINRESLYQPDGSRAASECQPGAREPSSAYPEGPPLHGAANQDIFYKVEIPAAKEAETSLPEHPFHHLIVKSHGTYNTGTRDSRWDGTRKLSHMCSSC